MTPLSSFAPDNGVGYLVFRSQGNRKPSRSRTKTGSKNNGAYSDKTILTLRKNALICSHSCQCHSSCCSLYSLIMSGGVPPLSCSRGVLHFVSLWVQTEHFSIAVLSLVSNAALKVMPCKKLQREMLCASMRRWHQYNRLHMARYLEMNVGVRGNISTLQLVWHIINYSLPSGFCIYCRGRLTLLLSYNFPFSDCFKSAWNSAFCVGVGVVLLL